METKRCWSCKDFLFLELFGKNRFNKDGLHTICKPCRKQRDKLRDRRRITTGLPAQSESVRIRKRLYRQNLRRRVISHLGSRCNSPTCSTINSDGSKGCTDERCLQIDHVNGGGKKEYELFNHTTSFHNKVLRDTTGMYQLLCANCNWIKRHTNNECS